MIIKSIVLLICLPLFILTGCSKAKSDKWLVGNIETRSAVSGELIDSYLEIIYLTNPGPNGQLTELKTEALGVTNEGYYELNKKITDDFESIRIYAYSEDKFHGRPGLKLLSEYEYIVKYKENNITLLLDPVYYLDVKLSNVNCFNEFDEISFQYSDPSTNFTEVEIFEGCIENQKTIGPIWSKTPKCNLHWVITRNGETSTAHKTVDLDFGIVNEVSIDY